MDFGLYLVPVLSGYWLLTHLHYTNYNVVRASGYHVFFQSAIAGGFLFVFAQKMSLDCNTKISKSSSPETRWFLHAFFILMFLVSLRAKKETPLNGASGSR